MPQRLEPKPDNDPHQTSNGTLVASLDDLLATKLTAALDRAEAADYRDIAAMISSGVSLAAGLSAFKQMFDGEPAQVLRAIGYFGDGDLNTLGADDREVLCNARDRIGQLPELHLKPGFSDGTLKPAPATRGCVDGKSSIPVEPAQYRRVHLARIGMAEIVELAVGHIGARG
jgi:hypothetical protein